VRGAQGRRVLKRVETMILDARNPVVRLLPPDIALEIWGFAYERPRNCGRLVADLRHLNVEATKTVLQRSVIKTLQQLQRILRLGYYTQHARLMKDFSPFYSTVQHGPTSVMGLTSVLLAKAKNRKATVNQLIGYCRHIVAVKEATSKMVEQLLISVNLAEEYARTGEIPTHWLGHVRLDSYDLPWIRNLRHRFPENDALVRDKIRSTRKKLAKDQSVLAMLQKPIDIRNK